MKDIMQKKIKKTSFFTCDLEDWYHILGSTENYNYSSWIYLKSNFTKGLEKLLKTLDRYNLKITFFIISEFAKIHKSLVKELHNSGHEIASHSKTHSAKLFQNHKIAFEELRDSKLEIEDITSDEVIGFRSPGFYMGYDFYKTLSLIQSAGYKYDSSNYPNFNFNNARSIYKSRKPFKVQFKNNKYIYEFPVVGVNLFFNRFNFKGGGFMRILPNIFFKNVNEFDNYYIHPRDIYTDLNTNVSNISKLKKIKNNIKIGSTSKKIDKILSNKSVQFMRLCDYYYENS